MHWDKVVPPKNNIEILFEAIFFINFCKDTFMMNSAYTYVHSYKGTHKNILQKIKLICAFKFKRYT